MHVDLISREKDFLDMAATLFLPEVNILRCTKYKIPCKFP